MEWDLIEWCRKEGGTIYANRPFKTKTGGPDMRAQTLKKKTQINPKLKKKTKKLKSLSNSLSLSSSSDDRVLSLPAAPPLHSVAGYAQKWAFQPHFKAPLKAKPSASYKKQKKRTLAPLSNPIATTEKAFRLHVRGDSGVRGVGEQWLAREVAEHAWGGQWWERRPQ